MMKRCLVILAGLVVVSLGAMVAYLEIREESQKAARKEAHKVRPYGIRDFDQVTPTLYRGAQPPEGSFEELKRLGVETVVTFRRKKTQVEEERRSIEELGMRFVNIPLRGAVAPTNHEVAEFLELVRSNEDKKIFVHCAAGHDRTGVMVATYRMTMENWTPEKALEEMKEHHYDPDLDPDHFLVKWYRGRWGFRQAWQEGSSRLLGRDPLKMYVESFPQQLQTDPDLRTLVPARHTEKGPPAGAGRLQ